MHTYSATSAFHASRLGTTTVQHDLVFLHGVFNDRFDSTVIQGMFGLTVPARDTRTRPILHVPTRVVVDSDFQADSTLTHLTIQVTQLWLNSTLYFSWLTQLWLNSNHKFSNLTQLWLNSFESELSQIWLTTHHILPNLGESCWPGGGGCGRM